MPVFLDAALALAKRGFKVFPVAPKTKNRPLTEHGFKDASSDESQIRAWWEATPNANIAAATGRASGVVVVDCDEGINEKEGPKKGQPKVGLQSLQQLQADNDELPDTLCQRTGRGGMQLFFVYPEGVEKVPCSVSTVAEDIDVRGDGGYVMVPPSIHPTGPTYEWLNDCSPAAMPPWLLELCLKKREQTSNAQDPIPPAQPVSAEDLEVAAEVLSYYWPGEKRHETELALAGVLARSGWDESVAVKFVLDTYQLVKDHDRSALGRVEHAVRTSYEKLRNGSNEVTGIPKLKTLITGRGLDAALLLMGITGEKKGQSTFGETQCAADIVKKEFAPLDWLIKSILTAEGLAVIADRPKHGKSWLVLQMAVAIATGRPFLRNVLFATGKPRRVCYFALEDSERRIKDRLQVVVGDDPLALSNIYFNDKFKLNVESIASLEAMLEQARGTDYPYGLIIIDPFLKICEKRNGKSDPVRADYAEMGLLQDIARKYGCGILLVHHTRKPNMTAGDAADDLLGTTGITAAPDTILTLRTSKDGERVFAATGKDCSLDNPIELKFDKRAIERQQAPWSFVRVYLDMTKDQNKLYELVEEKPGITREIAERFKKSENAVGKMLHRMAEDGLVETKDGNVWYVVEPQGNLNLEKEQ